MTMLALLRDDFWGWRWVAVYRQDSLCVWLECTLLRGVCILWWRQYINVERIEVPTCGVRGCRVLVAWGYSRCISREGFTALEWDGRSDWWHEWLVDVKIVKIWVPYRLVGHWDGVWIFNLSGNTADENCFIDCDVDSYASWDREKF